MGMELYYEWVKLSGRFVWVGGGRWESVEVYFA